MTSVLTPPGARDLRRLTPPPAPATTVERSPRWRPTLALLALMAGSAVLSSALLLYLAQIRLGGRSGLGAGAGRRRCPGAG